MSITAVNKNEGKVVGMTAPAAKGADKKEDVEFKHERNSIDIPTVKEKVEAINEYRDRIEEIIKPIYDKETYSLQKVFNEIEKVKDKAKNGGKLDISLLEVLFLDLVSETGKLSERIEERALDVDIATAFHEENEGKALLHASEMKEKKSLNNVNLQKAYAKNITLVDEYVLIVKNRLYKCLESKVSSADKLFYGIKAILGRR